MQQEIINTILKKLPETTAIYLFGSSVQGQERVDSDVDIAILPNEKLDPQKRWDLAQEIAITIKKDVDTRLEDFEDFCKIVYSRCDLDPPA